LGATIIEKHFTHDKTLPGNDHYHAMDVNDLKIFNKNLDAVLATTGSERVTALESENISRANARRSLVAKRDVPKGKKIVYDDLTWKRPAKGISPKFIEDVLGKEANLDIKLDEIINWKQIN
jgi:N-acetylneuraminate synthase